MNIKVILLFVAITIIASGCATKRYPLATPMSGSEASVLSCENLNLELIRADQIEKQINETGEFDGRTVLGFLGDFGIGNGMAKEEARSAVAARRISIREAQVNKGCIKAAPIEQNEPKTGETTSR